MFLIPSIEIGEGRVVREVGPGQERIIYSDDPLSVAASFIAMGARRLHLVDLDAAYGRPTRNLELIGEICQELEADFQVGGGVRTRLHFESLLELGANYVILGTAAIESPSLVEELARIYPEYLIVSIDAAEGLVKTRGWSKPTELRAVDLARQMVELGVRHFIHTDIIRDGTLSGVDFGILREFCSAVPHSTVLASGGVAGEADLRKLRQAKIPNLLGIIVGTSLYEGALSYPRGQAILTESGEKKLVKR